MFYMPFKPNASLQQLLHCILEVKEQLAVNFLYLNNSKTEAVFFNPSGNGVVCPADKARIPFSISLVITNFGPRLDPALKLDQQINSIEKACFFQFK